MAAYLIADQAVTDPALFEEFTRSMLEFVLANNGKYLARGGATEVVAGEREPNRVVVIEFESYEQLAASSTHRSTRSSGRCGQGVASPTPNRRRV